MPRFLRMSPSLVVLLALAVVSFTGRCWAGTESTILTFPNNGGTFPGGAGPYAGLISDAAGNLFGTTLYGGRDYVGVVFELVPQASGTYKEVVLYSFLQNHDCYGPMGRLLQDSAGNLYGAAQAGCAHSNGGVFELSPTGGGKYAYAVIYAFPAVANAGQPNSPLSMDSAGNLYGVFGSGGTQGYGQIYQLKPSGTGGWVPKIIYTFGHTGDGTYATGPLTLDSTGNIYGTTAYGGLGNGTVYEVSPAAGGWKEKLLYNFRGTTDGFFPLNGVTLAPTGDLFGTTDGSNGTVFRLSLSGSTWLKHVIHPFGAAGDGVNPAEYGSLTMDSSGNIYGSTFIGGTDNFGVVYELSPSGGTWSETILYSFEGSDDGSQPNADLLLDSSGNILGTTFTAGHTGGGTVFKITP